MTSKEHHLPEHMIQTINTLIGPYGYELKALIRAYETENSMDGDRWLPLDEATAFSGLKRHTLYRLTRDPSNGIIMAKTHPEKRSARILFLRSSLHNFLLNNSNSD